MNKQRTWRNLLSGMVLGIMCTLGAGSALAAGVQGVEINATNFPDSNFRNYVSTTFDTEGTKDGVLSPTEINQAKTIDTSGVSTFKGVEYFTALEEFYIHDCNKLTGLDLSGCTSLKTFDSAFSESLATINLSGCTSLTTITLNQNYVLKTLNLSDCRALKNADIHLCYGLSNLNLSNCTSLESLTVREAGGLTSLGLSNFPSLKYLNCSGDSLTGLNLSGCPSLESLYCEGNGLTGLDLSGCSALEVLYCHKNQIKTLDIRPCKKLEAEYNNNRYYAVKKNEEMDKGDSWYKNHPFIYDAATALITSKGRIEPTETADATTTDTITTTGTKTATDTTSGTEKEQADKKITITQKPTLKKLKAAAKGKITVTWNKFKKTSKTKSIWKKIKKIEVQYSTDPSFRENTKSAYTNKKNTKLTIKKLKKRTTYYVRVRYLDGKNGCSNWSKVKKVKTKKK